MTSDPREAVGILRGIKTRIEELESNIKSSEGIPNPLRSENDRSTTEDITDAREADAAVSDQSTTDDSMNAREADAAVSDRSTSADTISQDTDPRGAFKWDDADHGTWSFTEWASVLEAIERAVSDRSTTGDVATAAQADVSPSDRSNTSDTVTASDDFSGQFTWTDDDWDFQEWGEP